MAKKQKVDLHPGISSVRAIVTTRWDNRAYRPRVIRSIEQFTVDTALDSDADTWSVDLGDPFGQYVDMLRRDAEVRVQLFGVGNSPDYMMTGIADEVEFGDDGIWTLTGRDLSSLAMDSTVPPQQLRHVRAWAVVEQQAKALGFSRTNLAKGQMIRKVQHTDGSESYWEFWYRLYRKEKMWIWTEPNGRLVAGELNYGSDPVYFLGWPKASDPANIKKLHIPIEQMSVRKSTQSRTAEVWVFAHKGTVGFHAIAEDPTMKGWLKKPRKILLDSDAHTPTAAMKTGWEEIFEGKVGEIEYTITIPDPGFMLKQNQIARLRIPSLNIAGDFFVVGVRAQASTTGALQEIRLRDRQMALTRRIPSEPKALGGAAPKKATVQTELGQQILSGADVPQGWGNYFVNAANEWHGPWDFNLFLATLLGIAYQETGGSFKNERENGGPGGDHIEWTPPPGQGRTTASISDAWLGDSIVKLQNIALGQWKEQFANEAGDGYVTRDFGVGPMQLTSIGIKNSADDHFQANFRDEFQGGRWHPEHNIWAGAKFFRECLQGTVQDSGRDDDIWMGVMAYNRGVQGAIDYFNANKRLSSYAMSVKKIVNTDPGYLADIKTARDTAIQNAAQPATPDNKYDQPPAPNPGKVNSDSAIASLTHITKAEVSVDLAHVDWRLLVAVNNLGAAIGQTITITSGFRTFAQQVAAWDNQNHNPLLAANPYTTTSNHQIGEAVDCLINGKPIGQVVSASLMEKYGIHCPVLILYGTDPVHVTRLPVWG